MSDDSTLGGYLEIHSRPPAFEGSDGEAYSAAVFVDDQPDENGRFGAAVLFVRWSQSGDRPVGHLESPYLAYGGTAEEAGAGVRRLTLHEIKQQLDNAIAESKERTDW
ncbi:MAG: hypothetical protein JSW43_10425 [Gemmatimonadota bacterium]|nr:MAG: hypothetical protein JSW43_10425 [Gemmatimonadota bacterium]